MDFDLPLWAWIVLAVFGISILGLAAVLVYPIILSVKESSQVYEAAPAGQDARRRFTILSWFTKEHRYSFPTKDTVTCIRDWCEQESLSPTRNSPAESNGPVLAISSTASPAAPTEEPFQPIWTEEDIRTSTPPRKKWSVANSACKDTLRSNERQTWPIAEPIITQAKRAAVVNSDYQKCLRQGRRFSLPVELLGPTLKQTPEVDARKKVEIELFSQVLDESPSATAAADVLVPTPSKKAVVVNSAYQESLKSGRRWSWPLNQVTRAAVVNSDYQACLKAGRRRSLPVEIPVSTTVQEVKTEDAVFAFDRPSSPVSSLATAVGQDLLRALESSFSFVSPDTPAELEVPAPADVEMEEAEKSLVFEVPDRALTITSEDSPETLVKPEEPVVESIHVEEHEKSLTCEDPVQEPLVVAAFAVSVGSDVLSADDPCVKPVPAVDDAMDFPVTPVEITPEAAVPVAIVCTVEASIVAASESSLSSTETAAEVSFVSTGSIKDLEVSVTASESASSSSASSASSLSDIVASLPVLPSTTEVRSKAPKIPAKGKRISPVSAAKRVPPKPKAEDGTNAKRTRRRQVVTSNVTIPAPVPRARPSPVKKDEGEKPTPTFKRHAMVPCPKAVAAVKKAEEKEKAVFKRHATGCPRAAVATREVKKAGEVKAVKPVGSGVGRGSGLKPKGNARSPKVKAAGKENVGAWR
ncbi:hypothetical protein GLOTRDRAFT_126076 [Gloeophyllum trabeum ATCC 11539]|uniref:Uncharacterized protein n=1 Tax=Gloeophyllum trabeum (strain ATCC 11539 / FP-39264 / Madison 617) TaxID=670483 RepID=S7S1Y3_GLOTA|nr:uncharacterized protein GLOTRDRAFT_126076 [Gloeophyllum trabeum ATCC 11539]EPQ59779.1 hypothetical protein GLOTRDRAFT_126076 [Gloeophyllum trabeum ATCC 11539]